MPFSAVLPPAMRRTVRAFLVHDGVPVGGIAVGVMLGTYALLGLTPGGPLLVLAFCGTTLVYQFDRALGLSPEDRYNRPGRRAWMRGHHGYVWGTALLCVVVGGAMLPLLRTETVLAGAGIGAFGGLYVLPVFGRRLKSFGQLKPLVIAGAWALGSVLLPVLEAGRAVTVGAVALMAYRFAFVLANVLLSDWGDRAGDARAGLHTVATAWPAPVLIRVVRKGLGVVLVGGLVVAAVYHLPLLLVDLVGLVVMIRLVGQIEARPTSLRRFALDAIVAWPFVTALVAWLAGVW